MPADLTLHGTLGAYLKAEGWIVKPTWRTKGTASCNPYTQTVLMLPPAYRVANKPGRIRDYVLEHELAHAGHAALLSWDVTELCAARNISKAAGLEVVADAWCAITVPTAQMRRWVRASVAWHGKVGYRYRMADVDSSEAAAVVRRMQDMLAMWEAGRG